MLLLDWYSRTRVLRNRSRGSTRSRAGPCAMSRAMIGASGCLSERGTFYAQIQHDHQYLYSDITHALICHGLVRLGRRSVQRLFYILLCQITTLRIRRIVALQRKKNAVKTRELFSTGIPCTTYQLDGRSLVSPRGQTPAGSSRSQRNPGC